MHPPAKLRLLLITATVAAFVGLPGSRFVKAEENAPKLPPPLQVVVDFSRDVAPIFQQRCYTCHGPSQQMNGLRLDQKDTTLKGGYSGAVILPGNSAESKLLLRVASSKDGFAMPLVGPRLTEKEIATLRAWIDQGAPWPEATPKASEKVGPSPGEQHWAFQPIQRPTPPQVMQQSWVRNPIDTFVLAKLELESEGISPSLEADRATLIRRLGLDLLGLLPTPAEVNAFVSDTHPDAYGRLVERLLASPHYGERWGRHWLDVVHYADSNGYNQDDPRKIWMYRDWVIQALNQDLPFDQFVIEQVAGDLLPSRTEQQIVATGFYRNTLINLEGGIDFEQYRTEAVVDRVNTTGAAFLGLTLGCARCHDHKYDPISQREFYEFYAFFNSIDELSGEWGEEGRKRPHEPLLEFGTPEEFARREAIRAQLKLLENELAEYEESLLAKQPQWEKNLSAAEGEKLKPEVQGILGIPPAERNTTQKEVLAKAFLRTDPGYVGRETGIEALRAAEPKLKSTMVMRELPKPRETYMHIGGDFLRKGIKLNPGTPAILPALPSTQNPNRLDLARWLVDPLNPLTPRVTVNRVWQRYFGKGLVKTENDFGTQASPPSHPQLLDWLASEFIAQGWSLKAIHRLILNSATYRQSSRHRDDLLAIDPHNRLLARQSRLRLESEIIRDAALSASGLFAPKIGGPSVFPPQPEGVSRLTQNKRDWIVSTGADRYRRGMYTFFWRSSPHPGLMVFDSPDSTTACTRRSRSNTPVQALTLLNDEAFYEFAQGLARRVLREAPPTDRERISYAFQLCLARKFKPHEHARLAEFLAVQLEDFRTHPDQAHPIVPRDLPPGTDVYQLAAWTTVSRVLLNLDEFITRE